MAFLVMLQLLALLLLLLLVLLLLPALVWVAGFLVVTEVFTPLRPTRSFHRVLAIFPHPDDEAITCGGFLHHLAQAGSVVTLVTLTKGERGTPTAVPDERLKVIRTREAETVAAILGISRHMQCDFGDGELQAKRAELTAFLATTIAAEQPDLLITYDRAGLYGHADHIICSEVVTQLRANRFPTATLWYVTLPKHVLARVRLPKHLASIAGAPVRPVRATLKVFIGRSVFARIAAWYAYKSQRATLREGVRKYLPIWFFLSMMLFEYFAEV